jgi:hypothetical protein
MVALQTTDTAITTAAAAATAAAATAAGETEMHIDRQYCVREERGTYMNVT